MKNSKKYSFLAVLFCLLISSKSVSQTNYTDVAMPSQQNKIIIDKIVEAVHYKTYVIDFCLSKINEASAKEGWNEQKSMEIIQSVNYKNFKDAIYNSFVVFDEVELETLLNAYEKDPAYQTINVMTNNKVLINNLKIFASDIVKGKYVSK
ncbi:hypothetical protein [Flavobacterium johnsoniae]|uniref:DUF2059 domain-containing protein n=1 Tax=Flavobacterium johnsoniae (strain ATCC 17061 / DSM 2064 / JCM 8514 / BCRC 14874 / CCUG 350202 / NBRC 14942 / NCIMB 11054 / UW101) TaxID=376686 RepID=A5FMN6_FLAJ1|nr:hypothetical protein [Flavobacterium johnsoniae]ABQ03536.1 hypothetical protein Fjoh_0501 [Flavobacterium johnsoniae UW101]OXE95958.1 hypothetical protein B0A63_22605 [Flavobacterium johnsoniae UW101]WQG79599.1 hypothetical protein SR927_16380 [Flavobacterium johnsoniae UW101]SHL95089.1 hypothetical protein SAMN05444146_5009 [Flavobacterium johnsoniae]